jgi:hypothetical protein
VNRFCAVLENGSRPGKHSLSRDENPIRNNGADVAELVDARDLKSLDGNVVWVRVPPPAPAFSLEKSVICPCIATLASRSLTSRFRIGNTRVTRAWATS